MKAKILITDRNGKAFEGEVELSPVTAPAAASKAHPSKKVESYRGPSGGVRMLHSKGFFASVRTLGAVRDALAKEGYHYGAAPVQTALNRLSTRTGLLATSRKGGKKVYVRRK